MIRLLTITSILCVMLTAGCTTTGGEANMTRAEQRLAIVNMKNDVLTDLYRLRPELRAQVNSAPGYAVFSNVNVNVIFASLGGGRGLAKNNQTGEVIFMRMGEAGLGLGLGVKDFRAVFVFHSHDSLKRFINDGWSVGAHADAAAKSGEKGVAVAGEVIADDISVYQLTENGIALQASVKGTKYWRDDDLN